MSNKEPAPATRRPAATIMARLEHDLRHYQSLRPLSCQQMSNHALQSLKRSFRNLNRLANFDGGIDSHDFFRTHSRLKRGHNIFRQGCQAIPKVDDPSDPVRTFNGAMLFPINKFREQITGKHRLHEPDWPSSGHLAETQSRRKTLDVKLTPDRGRGRLLSLRLRL